MIRTAALAALLDELAHDGYSYHLLIQGDEGTIEYGRDGCFPPQQNIGWLGKAAYEARDALELREGYEPIVEIKQMLRATNPPGRERISVAVSSQRGGDGYVYVLVVFNEEGTSSDAVEAMLNEVRTVLSLAELTQSQ